jgi:methylated-DNA-[protein]-cysteine S-methyltransferase
LESNQSSPLNQFTLDLDFGSLALLWTKEGLIQRLDVLPKASCVIGEEPKGRGFSGILLSAKRVPTELLTLVDQLWAFFEEGKPLPETPWSLIDQTGWTPFQKKVLEITCRIPFGETRNYGWVSEKIGQINASRAVGQTLRRNPIPILIPCHRVVRAEGTLGGFMGVSTPNQPETLLKKRLIEIEEEYRSPFFDFFSAPIPHPPQAEFSHF